MNPHNLKFTGQIQVYKRIYDVFKELLQYSKIQWHLDICNGAHVGRKDVHIQAVFTDVHLR